MGDIWVGTCGYQYFDPGAGWQEQHESKLAVYSTRFPIVEVNRSFYRLPEIKTVQRWRRETVTGFEYSMKVWQAITHPWQSPTWNDNRDQIPESKTDTVGFFQPTETVYDAWEKTRARATALDAAVVVFQTPPSFDCSETHIANMREFFQKSGVMASR